MLLLPITQSLTILCLPTHPKQAGMYWFDSFLDKTFYLLAVEQLDIKAEGHPSHRFSCHLAAAEIKMLVQRNQLFPILNPLTVLDYGFTSEHWVFWLGMMVVVVWEPRLGKAGIELCVGGGKVVPVLVLKLNLLKEQQYQEWFFFTFTSKSSLNSTVQSQWPVCC